MTSLSTADPSTAEISDIDVEPPEGSGIEVEPPVVYDGIVIEPPPDDSFMDPAGYFSEKLFDLEMRVVYPRSWVFVGDLSQLRKPGDYVTETIGTEPVMVVRGRDGTLRAFVNVCPHRASTLVEGSGNCGRALVCPYHGWTFHLDGRLAATPHPRGFVEPVDRGAYSTSPVSSGFGSGSSSTCSARGSTVIVTGVSPMYSPSACTGSRVTGARRTWAPRW